MCSISDGGCEIAVTQIDHHPHGGQSSLGMAPGLSIPILGGLVHKWFDDHNDVFRDWDMRKIMADSIRLSRQFAIGPQYLFIRVDFGNGVIRRTSINADPHTVPAMFNINNTATTTSGGGGGGTLGSNRHAPSRGVTAASIRRANNTAASSKRVSKIIFYMELPSCSMEMRDAIVETCRDGRSLAERVYKTVRCAIHYRFDFRIAMELFDETSMYYMPAVAAELSKHPLLFERLYELQIRVRDLRITSNATAETQKTWWISPPLCWLSKSAGIYGGHDRECGGMPVVSESDMRSLGESISADEVGYHTDGVEWNIDTPLIYRQCVDGMPSTDETIQDESYDSDDSNHYISTAWDDVCEPDVQSDDDMTYEEPGDNEYEEDLSDDNDRGDSYF